MTSLSTHVLDTGAGKPAEGVLIVLYRGDMFMAEMRTDDDGRARLSDDLDPGTYRLVFHPPRPSSSASSWRSSSTRATTTSRC